MSAVQELQLIQKVELRFALADTNEKFQSALNIYLAPLLLKFASTDKQVRLQLGKTIKFLLSKFNSTPSLKLPCDKLLDQIKSPNLKPDQDPTIVQSYTLLFLSKSIARLSIDEQLNLFPLLLENISSFKDSIAARLFNISCKILENLNIDSDLPKLYSNDKLLSILNDDNKDGLYLLEKYYKFMLLHSIPLATNGIIPNDISQPGLSKSDCSFFFYYAGVTFTSSLLSDYKLKILKFLEGFKHLNTALVFLCASADSDSKISTFAWTCLKRIPIDYENKVLINQLVDLFTGTEEKPPVRIQLQEKILNILCKSKFATTINSIDKISSIGLNSSNIKLKQSTVAFVRWFTTNTTLNALDSNDETVAKIAHQLKLNLSDLSADRSSPNYLDNRRYQYETLGLLLKKSTHLLDIPYIQFLMDMHNIDDKDLQPTIQDALIGLTTNLSSLSENQQQKLKDLLIEMFEKSNDPAGNNNINQTRYIGVKYINYLFPFDDAESRIINILAQSKYDKIETIEEAKKGLNPYLFRLNNNTAELNIEFPQFDKIVKYIMKYREVINLDVAITFSIRCLIMNIVPEDNTIVAVDQYWETRIDKALEIDSSIKHLLISRLKEFHDLDGDIVDDFANSSLKKFISIAFDFVLVSNSLSVLILLTRIISLCSNAVTNMLTSYIPSLLNNQLETFSNESFHYVSQLAGIICTSPTVSDEKILEILNKLVKENSISSIGFIISRLILRGRINIVSNSLFESVLALLEHALNPSSTKLLRMALDCISQLSMFGCLGPDIKLCSTVDSYKEKFVEKLKPLVQKCNEHAIYTWCYLSLSYSNPLSENQELNLFEKNLYETHTTKQPDNLFTTGEGFVILCDGWSSNFMKDKNDIPECDNPITLNPNRCKVILDTILTSCKTTKPSLRKASCIWLLSIVQYCTDEVILERISEIQFAFMRFLSDREEIVQDSASRGLSITYEKGGYDIQETLVHNLLQSFTDTNKTTKELMSGYVDENTQLFDSGVLNTGDGESVSTYKDVLNLASEVGNPSLVYKFMSLAKNSALWSSRKGLAFGLGAILDKEKLDKLLKENPNLSDRLIPKLFRYKYDPSPSISRTMNNIWNSLILNNKVTLEENFDSIMKELLKGMGDREWRIREASSSALQDLLRQCEFSKFENDLEKIWLMAFRAMDDIKSSVRKEGTELTRFLANTMVLKLNSASSNTTVQESILKQLVPFLLGNNGLLSDSEDVKKFAFDTIMKLISTHSKSLKPFVSNMVKQMILLMSSVEPQVINYLTLNADKYNLKVEDIDSQRIGIVGSSPMMEAIEKLMDLLDEDTIDEFIENLASAIKASIGLPSKVAGSKVIVNLILRHFFIVQNRGDKILKIASGQLKDKNETVAKSYAIACGYCIRISSIKKIESFGKKLNKYYFEKKADTNSDDKLPKVVSIACDAISNFANDTLNANGSIFLPLTFIGKHDLNDDIAKNFNKVWSDCTSSSVNSIKLYFPEIIALIKSHIQSQTFSLRKTIALSIIEIIDTLDTKINDLNPTSLKELYELLLESLNGRVYDGKEKLLDSLVKLSCKSSKFLSNDDELYSRIEKRVLTEANRKNKVYKRHSILALGNFLHVFYEDETLYDKYLELVDDAISPKGVDSDDEYDHDVSDVDGDSKMFESSESKKTNAAVVELTQKLLTNVVYSISNEEGKINERTLHYIFDKLNELLTNINIDYLPNSDSKYKFKQGIINMITTLIDVYVKSGDGSYRVYFKTNLFNLWLKSKELVGSSDNLQSTLVGFTRVTGKLLENVDLDSEKKNQCIMALKLLKSENVNSVITIECEKILAKNN